MWFLLACASASLSVQPAGVPAVDVPQDTHLRFHADAGALPSSQTLAPVWDEVQGWPGVHEGVAEGHCALRGCVVELQGPLPDLDGDWPALTLDTDEPGRRIWTRGEALKVRLDTLDQATLRMGDRAALVHLEEAPPADPEDFERRIPRGQIWVVALSPADALSRLRRRLAQERAPVPRKVRRELGMWWQEWEASFVGVESVAASLELAEDQERGRLWLVCTDPGTAREVALGLRLLIVELRIPAESEWLHWLGQIEVRHVGRTVEAVVPHTEALPGLLEWD